MSIINILLEITVYSGVIFIFVMLLKTLFKDRMSPLLHYAVWALFVVRLLVPVTIASPVHLFVIPVTQSHTASEQAEPQANETATVSSEQTADSSYTQPQNVIGTDDTPAVTTAVPYTQPASLSLPDIIVAGWLVGMGTRLIFLIVQYLFLRRKIRRSAVLPAERLLTLFEEVKAELDINADVKLFCLYEYGTPALMFPRTVLMPVDALVAMDDGQLKLALRHELTHLRRGDHIVSIVLTLLGAVYWFNPFVWLALREMRADMETACDGSVVKTMDSGGKQNYASLIVSLFAQPRHRRLVLGMARGDTKRIAERRVRGIFMNGSSCKGVKLTSAVLSVLLFVTCFTTACQPTPGNAAVRQKDGNVALQANAVPYNKADFPGTYKDSFSKNGTDITFDAVVKTPDSDALPTYDISPAPFTQMQVDTIIKALFGDTQMYEPAQVTKSQLEPAYLEALSVLNDKKANPDQYENTLEYYQSEVDHLKQEMENAPETDSLVPVDRALKTSSQGTQYYSGRGDLGKNEMAMIMIENSTNYPDLGDHSFLQFSNGNEYMDMSYYYSDIQDKGPSNLKTTKEQAIAQANGIVSRLGAGYMEYAGCATGLVYDEREFGGFPAEFDPQIPQAYLVYYTRTRDSVPVTYDLRASSGSLPDNAYSAPVSYERITVMVDDTGVANVRWQAPIGITNASVPNNKVIPFENIVALAKEKLSFYYAVYQDNEQPMVSGYAMAQPSSPVDNGDVVSNSIHIQAITLGLMQLPIKNENRSQLVPVWDFFGYYETKYRSGASVMHYMNGKSILTINAVTGSVIDRNLGY